MATTVAKIENLISAIQQAHRDNDEYDEAEEYTIMTPEYRKFCDGARH